MIAIIMVGSFVTLLNQLIIGSALPAIMKEFNITATTGQLLTSTFLLVNGLMVPVTAFLINRFTSRQIFMSAMCAFTAGSVVAALSNGFYMLLLGRVMQALGAGVMFPLTTVMLLFIFPKNRRGFALGIMGIATGCAPAFGPVLSGWIVDEWGWRFIFVVIAPISAILMVLAFFSLRNVVEREAVKLDIISVIMSTIGFGGLLYGFSMAGSEGWTAPRTFLPIAVGAVVLVFFVRRQLSQEKPMLNLRIMKKSAFSISTLLVGILNAVLTIGAFLTPIFIQTVQGRTAFSSGLLLMPGAILMACMSPIAGIFFDRFGPRTLSIIGMPILAAGSLMLSFLQVDTSYFYTCFGYSMRMFGISLVNMPINTWGLNMLPNRLIAHGNAINNTARQVGASLGTAVLVTIMMITSANTDGSAQIATTAGINAAFRGAGFLAIAALIITILRVKGNNTDEN